MGTPTQGSRSPAQALQGWGGREEWGRQRLWTKLRHLEEPRGPVGWGLLP